MATQTLPDKRLTPDYKIVEEETEFIEAGAVTFGMEYRFLPRRDAEGKASDRIMDHGICIHVLDGSRNGKYEHLRFDCLQNRPHYHYLDWTRGKDDWYHEHATIDTAADGDAFQWTIERLRSKLPSMLVRARADDLARRLDQEQIEAALPKITAWATILRERALSNFKGTLDLWEAGVPMNYIRTPEHPNATVDCPNG